MPTSSDGEIIAADMYIWKIIKKYFILNLLTYCIYIQKIIRYEKKNT